MSRRLGFALSAALLATVVVTTPAQAATITYLGNLEGGTHHSATSINDAGVAVGRSTADGRPERAVKYNANGTVTELVGPAGANTRVTAINNRGYAAGSTFEPNVRSRAVRFDPDGGRVVLSSVWGYDFASAQAIDDNRAVYGTVTKADVSSQLPVRWDANGLLTTLRLPAGMTKAVVTGASNGYAVGYVYSQTSDSKAVRWNPDGSVTRLTGLDERAASLAWAVNRHGEVVGEAYSANNFGVLGVRWGLDGSIITEYGGNAHPRGINDHGVAVGFNTVAVGDNVPVRWSTTGAVLELGRPDGARRVEAVDINNDGVIVGYTGDNYSPLTALKWTVN